MEEEVAREVEEGTSPRSASSIAEARRTLRRSSTVNNVACALAQVTEVAARALRVERASVWRLDA